MTLTNVDLVSLAVLGVNCVLRDMRDLGIGKMAVRLRKGFKISRSRSNASTANFPIGNHHSTELWIMVEFRCHLFSCETHRILCSF